jgi:uncharacterized protein (UPF0305 family)
MINIFIFLTSFLAGFVFYLLKRINDLQQQVILLDKEQHEQNKEMLEMFEFKIQQAKLNIAVVEKLEEMIDSQYVVRHYGIVGEA